MAKADTVKDIKAANGQDVPESLKQDQLDELLKLAQGGEEKLDAFNKRLDELSPKKPEAPEAPKEKTVSVRVSDTIAAFGGEFVDPESRVVIGKTAVDVPLTGFVRQKLRSDELVEA